MRVFKVLKVFIDLLFYLFLNLLMYDEIDKTNMTNQSPFIQRNMSVIPLAQKSVLSNAIQDKIKKYHQTII